MNFLLEWIGKPCDWSGLCPDASDELIRIASLAGVVFAPTLTVLVEVWEASIMETEGKRWLNLLDFRQN